MRALTVLLFISLKKLNAAEYLNLMSRLRVLIETATPEALGLTAAEFAEFTELVDKLQRRVNWTSSSELTETLDLLDKQRDNLLSLLFGVISSYTSLPDTALGKAAIWLERVTRPYKSIQTAPAQQESVQINGLLLDLEAEEAKTHLATLHLTEQVAELKQIREFAFSTRQCRIAGPYPAGTQKRIEELDETALFPEKPQLLQPHLFRIQAVFGVFALQLNDFRKRHPADRRTEQIRQFARVSRRNRPEHGQKFTRIF